MGYRLIIATMCVGYLIGYVIGIFQAADAVFGFETRVVAMSYGLGLATLFGFVVCAVDGFIWFIDSRPKRKILVPAPLPRAPGKKH